MRTNLNKSTISKHNIKLFPEKQFIYMKGWTNLQKSLNSQANNIQQLYIYKYDTMKVNREHVT